MKDKIDKALLKISDEEDISYSSLVSQIFVKHIEWDYRTEKYGYVHISKAFFKGFIELLTNNQLIEEIPLEIGNLNNLIYLDLFNNQLTGEIPENICDLNINWSSSSYFSISNNQLCPPYPSCIEDYVGYQDTTNCDQISIMDETFPFTYKLHSAYPNPFNPVTTLRYELPEDALVNITIYDMMGRQVKTLINDQQTAGYRSLQWNAANDAGSPVSAGLYLYTIEAGEFRQAKKMILLK